MAKFKPKKSWAGKFKNAFRGVVVGIKDQNSFAVHIPVAILVIVVAAVCQVSLERMCILLLCIATVMGAELFNSSIESLAKSITDEEDAHIGRALDIASGAVLVVAAFAVIVGLIILVQPVLNLF